MKQRVPSEFMGVKEFMADLSKTVLAGHFLTSEEPADEIDEIFEDLGGGKDKPDDGEHGDLTSEDDTEDGDNHGGDNDGGGGGADDVDDANDDGRSEDYAENYDLRETEAGKQEAAKAAEAVAAKSAAEAKSIADKTSGMFKQSFKDLTTEPKPDPSKISAYNQPEPSKYDPFTVRASIQAAIQAGKDKLAQANAGTAAEPTRGTRPTQAAANSTVIVMANAKSEKLIGPTANKTQAPNAVNVGLPNGSTFIGSVPDAIKAAAAHKEAEQDLINEALRRKWKADEGDDGEMCMGADTETCPICEAYGACLVVVDGSICSVTLPDTTDLCTAVCGPPDSADLCGVCGDGPSCLPFGPEIVIMCEVQPCDEMVICMDTEEYCGSEGIPCNAEVEPCEVGPCEVQPCEVQPCEVDPCEVEPCEVGPCEVQPCEVQPCEVDPCEVEPCEVEPCEVEPCEVEPCEVEPCEVDECIPCEP